MRTEINQTSTTTSEGTTNTTTQHLHAQMEIAMLPGLRNAENDTRPNTNDQNQRHVTNNPPKTIEELFEQQSVNMNKNFERLNEGITNLVKLMSSGRFPAQPVHHIDGNTQGQSSNKEINAVTILRSGKTLLKRSEEGNDLNNFQNNFYPDKHIPLQVDFVYEMV